MSEIESLPVVVILGPRKCGTTTIHALLRGIDGVAIPWPKKEAHIFNQGPVPSAQLRAIAGDTWNNRSLVFVDISTHYFSEKQHWQAIRGTLSLKHVCVMLRDPIDRTISHCLHQMRISGNWSDHFDAIVKSHPEVITDSLYSETIPALIDFFGPDSVRLIPFRMIADSPKALISRVVNHDGLEINSEIQNVPTERMNPAIRPALPMVYQAARKAAGFMRPILGSGFIEFFKPTIIRIWPQRNLDQVKSSLLEQIEKSEVHRILVEEQDYLKTVLE